MVSPPGPAPTTDAVRPATDGTPGPLPAGYRWQQDEEGFRFPIPTDAGVWQRRVSNGNIYYTPDGQKHLIQFAVSVGEQGSPLDHLRSMAADDRTLKDYKEVKLGATTVNGHEGAYWVFTYTATDKAANPGPRKLFEEEFKDSDGTAYAILLSAPIADATAAEQRFTMILNNFTVTRRSQSGG
ncbi:hypothetical protein C7C46_17280 [Streptomyces tateyamensis]|uniref:Serine/arginine repetitive matrix protein 2 n=1 Tax=Streptomyces tateyamensis TaxID=565073 RepID=A0A2V4P1I6_9ACTN|nr:hypothetical protein C7C46_17280 [Streptomyces tateyamensis]